MSKKITFDDFKDADYMEEVQEAGWVVQINNVQVSIVKWKSELYDGDYEIYSNDLTFHDVERYKTMTHVLIRLTELWNNSKSKDKVFDWSLKSHAECEVCGEEACEEVWTNGRKRIVTRDCQPESFDKLPAVLLKAMKGFE